MSDCLKMGMLLQKLCNGFLLFKIKREVKEVNILHVLLKKRFFNPFRPNSGRRENYFHTSLWCPKGFMKALKVFIKAFEAPQGNCAF